MRLTAEQEQIVETSRHAERLVVNALAGTGKTSTAIACAKAQTPCNIVYLCFNKANADEMRAKFKSAGIASRMDVTTLHALAYRHIGSFFLKQGRELGDIRPYDIEEFCKIKDKRGHLIKDRAIGQRLRKLVLDGLSLWCHGTATNMADFWKQGLPRALERQLAEYNASLGSYRKNVEKLWQAVSATDAFPLTHDAYLKIFQMYIDKFAHKLGYDLVIVDEAQDLFPVTESIVASLTGMGGRLLCLGDRYQQIYSWNKSVNSMERFEKDAEVLELTQSFRCPQQVIDEAVPWLRLLGFEGEFRPSPTGKDLPDMPAALISRTNAGLLQALDELVQQGMSVDLVHPLGGASRYSFQTVYDRLAFMGGKYDRIQSPQIRTLKTEDEWDECAFATLDMEMSFAKQIVNRLGVERTVQMLDLFRLNRLGNSLENSTVCLTTAHRSKGFEFEHTIMLDTFVDLVEDCEAYHEMLALEGQHKREEQKDSGKDHRKVQLLDSRELEEMEYAAIWGEQQKPWPLDAEELRLAYVALTRASKKVTPGKLSLQGWRLQKLEEFLEQKLMRLYERDAKGDLRPFVPRQAGRIAPSLASGRPCKPEDGC